MLHKGWHGQNLLSDNKHLAVLLLVVDRTAATFFSVCRRESTCSLSHLNNSQAFFLHYQRSQRVGGIVATFATPAPRRTGVGRQAERWISPYRPARVKILNCAYIYGSFQGLSLGSISTELFNSRGRSKRILYVTPG